MRCRTPRVQIDPQVCNACRQGNITLIHSAPTGESFLMVRRRQRVRAKARPDDKLRAVSNHPSRRGEGAAPQDEASSKPQYLMPVRMDLLHRLELLDRKSTRLHSSHEWISYAVFCFTKKIISIS